MSYYRRALQGQFFKNEETLHEYRRILGLADANARVAPLGASAFAKGGSIDGGGFHALCVPGALFFNKRWVYYCFTINWSNPAEGDPETVNAFLTAAQGALKLVFDRLS